MHARRLRHRYGHAYKVTPSTRRGLDLIADGYVPSHSVLLAKRMVRLGLAKYSHGRFHLTDAGHAVRSAWVGGPDSPVNFRV
jgi:hypothetical protein